MHKPPGHLSKLSGHLIDKNLVPRNLEGFEVSVTSRAEQSGLFVGPPGVRRGDRYLRTYFSDTLAEMGSEWQKGKEERRKKVRPKADGIQNARFSRE